MKATTSREAEALARLAFFQERCTCGNSRSLHGDGFGGAPGHGNIPGICPKYTWDGKSGPFATQ